MSRNPNWTEEETKLALFLYFSHDLRWLARMSDNTPEIMALSEILNNCDFHDLSNRGNKFRSTGSIKMKLSNFKAVDSKYGKESLSNISSKDRELFNCYSGKPDLLSNECKQIIELHYRPTHEPSDNAKQFINQIIVKRDELPKTTASLRNDIKSFLMSPDANNDPLIKKQCSLLLELLNESEEKEEINNYQEHGGINQEIVVANEKIGKTVRSMLSSLVEKGLIKDRELNNLQSQEWCAQNFHLRFPLLKRINDEEDYTEQRKDKNGYPRYWNKIFIINGKKYFVCKEWFETQRKYITVWYDQLISNNKPPIDRELFERLCIKTKEIDEKEVFVSTRELINCFPNNQSEINIFVNYLFAEGIAVSFQGSLSDFCIEDYEKWFELFR